MADECLDNGKSYTGLPAASGHDEQSLGNETGKRDPFGSQIEVFAKIGFRIDTGYLADIGTLRPIVPYVRIVTTGKENQRTERILLLEKICIELSLLLTFERIHGSALGSTTAYGSLSWKRT